MTIAIIDSGSRGGGNTEILTERVVQDLPADSILLRDYHIQPIQDRRHAQEVFKRVRMITPRSSTG